MKTLIYVILAAAEDEETQKRGLIGILYFTNALPFAQKLYDRSEPRIFDWLPIKLVGAHFCSCHSDARFRIIHALLLLVMGRERRVRLRMHEGTSLRSILDFDHVAPPTLSWIILPRCCGS